MVDIATNWEEISGKRDWRGLMDPLPLDTNLSKFITICGERVQAIYDSLNRTTALPLYAKENFFSEVGLVTDKPYQLYTVTNYLYVRSDVVSILDIFLRDLSAWIGYVAVATDEGKRVLGRRDILICWRGTTYLAEWAKNLESALGPATEIFGNRTENRLVHQGFLSTYISARELVRNAVRRQVDQYKDEEISITVAGHSLGAALATLNAADIVANGYNKPTGSHKVCMVTGFVFASPMVGDTNFTTVFNNQSNLHLLHIRHEKDPVPRLPGGIKYSQMGVTLSRYATDFHLKKGGHAGHLSQRWKLKNWKWQL